MKTSSLGDVVHQCPAVSDAARNLPDAEIHWLVEEAFAAVPAMHGAVRRVITLAIRRWRGRPWNRAVWEELSALRATLRAERYDAVIDTQGLLKSAFASRLAGAPIHGMDRGSAREGLAAAFYTHCHAVRRDLHAVERNRLLTAAALGYRVHSPADYGLRLSTAHSEQPYAVALTMTSRADKLWPVQSWVELVSALKTTVMLPWGSEAERLRAEEIAGRTSAQVPERMPLEQVAALLSRAQLVVGLDTGLTHLAAALGVQTVGLYCGSDPGLTGLYGAPLAVSLGAPGRPPSVASVLEVIA